MKKTVLLVMALFACCSYICAQNSTVRGPKGNKQRSVVVQRKLRANNVSMKRTQSVAKKHSAQERVTVSSPTGYINGYGYVDLGLSVKWATCNVGASSPEAYGDYFKWGELQTAEVEEGESPYLGLGRSKLISMGLIDNFGNLSPSCDAAHIICSSSWRMPTKGECNELCENCEWKFGTYNSVKGFKVTGPSGKSIFLPASGVWSGGKWREYGGVSKDVDLWASTFYDEYYGEDCNLAYKLSVDIYEKKVRKFCSFENIDWGCPIRPVSK